jgi:glucosamine-6-phosphate deaminase
MIKNKPIRQLRRDQLGIEIHESRSATGEASAMAAAEELRAMLSMRAECSVVFASARSQDEFLASLRTQPDIDWKRVTVFHLDEYVGLPADHPASFRYYLRDRLLSHVPVKEFHEIHGEAPDPAAECARYAELLDRQGPVLIALGIGENGHLAFIDPHVCDFADPEAVRPVELDEACRRQQVHDGAFVRLEDVPLRALSMTVPCMLRAPRVVVTVPGPTKRQAVKEALDGPIAETCPASALRRHPRATLYLDEESSMLLR